MSDNLKVLLIDLETFPNLGYTWSKYDQNVIRFKQETCIATFAAKWLDGKMVAKSLADYKGYKPGSYDDKALVQDLWDLFDQADILVAHNGKDFDIKVARARFLFHGLNPPSPFKIVDTKDAVKKVGRFNSASLNDLANYLGFGKKIKTDFDLWEGCINGDETSWHNMVKYNKMDVILLEKLYLKLLPWITNHPHVSISDRASCPKCGSEKINYRGFATTTTRKYRKFQCMDCGGWGRATHCDISSKTTNSQSD